MSVFQKKKIDHGNYRPPSIQSTHDEIIKTVIGTNVVSHLKFLQVCINGDMKSNIYCDYLTGTWKKISWTMGNIWVYCPLTFERCLTHSVIKTQASTSRIHGK